MIEVLLRILAVILEELGPAVVRQKVDEWEAAKAATDVAFTAKFGEKPE